jgi:high affinity choline transporter 7
LIGYILGLFFRLAGGEAVLNIPVLIKYPYYNDADGQLFPFKTLSMIISLTSVLVFSFVTNYLFKNEILPKKADIFKCIVNRDDVGKPRKEYNEQIEMSPSDENPGKMNPTFAYSNDDIQGKAHAN